MVAVNNQHEVMKPENGNSVLAFGKIIANGATNVIPAEVKLEGTIRALDENFREQIHAMLGEKAKEIFEFYHCGYDLEIKRGYPVLYNHETVTDACIRSAEEYLGKEQVRELELRMTAEDFAYYSQRIPACFYRLGTGNKAKGINSPVHTSTFDIDEESLKTGSGLLAYIAVQMLDQFPLPAK
jgi:metal-dependent amidase/aminoacylase/carboxypeptidase family protein